MKHVECCICIQNVFLIKYIIIFIDYNSVSFLLAASIIITQTKILTECIILNTLMYMIHLLLLSPNNEYKNEILPLNKKNQYTFDQLCKSLYVAIALYINLMYSISHHIPNIVFKGYSFFFINLYQELHTKLLLGSLLPYLGNGYSKIKDSMEPENVPFIHRLKYMHYSLMGKMKAALYRQ